MTNSAVYFSDLHCNQYNQFSLSHDRLSQCLDVIDDVFKLAKKLNSNTILFGGDLGDLPKHIYIAVIDALCIRFAKWFKKMPDVTLYAISGNHDQNQKNFWDNPAKTLLNVFATAFPGRFVLIDNKMAEVSDNVYVTGIPYYEHRACFDKALEKAYDCNLHPNNESVKTILLIHQTPEGLPNKNIKTETSPSDPRYAVFDLILDGHIHTKQIITPKFVVGGNPLHRDLGDIGQDKGIWVVDLDNPTDYEFISRKGKYPEFVRMAPEDITEEVMQTSFAVPDMKPTKVTLSGSAAVSDFGSTVSPADLLTNYWKEVEGTDEKLLAVGLSLLNG